MQVTFLGALTLLFIGLKLTGYIMWSWWWVLSPLWIPTAIVLSFLILAACGMSFCMAWHKPKDTKQNIK